LRFSYFPVLPRITYIILGKSKNDIVKDLINGVVMKFEEYKKKIEDEVKDKIYSKSYNDAL
jgi:uncharacterized protein YlzI (FlbEa/FlbD family)